MTFISLIRTALLVLVVSAPVVSAQWVRETHPLKPGWNAIFLGVAPEPARCDDVFAGLPVQSVWDFNPSVDSPQFLQDPSTLLPGAPQWLAWFPPGSPLAGQGTLNILRDGRPYLIKLPDDAAPLTWTVTGKPTLRKTTWRPGGLNFTGFHVGSQGPTFQTLFAGESGLVGQPVHRLNAAGTWEAIPDLSTARPVAGQAYWIRCTAPAQRHSTIEADPGSRGGLVFSDGTSEASLRIRNTSPSPRAISLRLLPSAPPPAGQTPLAGPLPMEYWKADYASLSLGWQPLPASLGFASLPAGAEWNVLLGVRLAGTAPALAGSEYQGIIEVTDDAGARWLVPARAEPAGTAASGRGLRQAPGAVPMAGLWMGEVLLDAVSQPARLDNPGQPRTSGGTFPFRLILHVDGAGTTRLLQRIYLVRKQPTYLPDPDNPGFNLINQPARTVLLTDESLLVPVVGPGTPLGRRISSAAYAFKDPVLLNGGPFGSGQLTGSITVGYDDPLSPFKHVYHPDHDNRNARFEPAALPEGRESFTVTRNISLEFGGSDPLGLNPPAWGDRELGGTYRETLTGLHRSGVNVSGTFRLVKVVGAAELNQ